ncbi:diguanylate cyclase [Vibrio sp. JC009]|uniref:GGDEF domain-containing response regulator n=1 Tax=Vibrio sp. JC009 TaxID=2912314 RepID=UPI0023B1B362|nr:diguanylate cyclase [Vibrio sp. JC009]WED21440.1 diguanylate cyclase [Vibrio sp. JC009]
MEEIPKVLIVDDRVENLITLENLLDSFNIELIRATSGIEALGHTLDHDFALVLLDVQMPEMDGYEVAELMRGNRDTRNIPIIFVTAESMGDAHVFKGYESGAVDYLFKPLQAEIFRSKVGVFIELFEQKLALKRKTAEFNRQLVEMEELQQQLEETNEQLLLLSTTDGLTGLLNKRRYQEVFEDEWQRALRANHSLSLVMIDIDHFKLYNDTFGHHAGDDCLKAVAASLQTGSLRHLDKVARVGGEEFAILLPETDKEGAAIVAERVRSEVEKLNIPHCEAADRDWVTVSVGYSSIVPDKEMLPVSLGKAADKALYDSKRNNRNCCSFREIKEEQELAGN